MKALIKRYIPVKLISQIRIIKNWIELKRHFPVPAKLNISNLKLSNSINLSELFSNYDIEKSWNKAKISFESFTIPDGSGGVNPGDRRAIFYLIRKFNPTSVLEIGTHIGASLIHIASALSFNKLSDNNLVKFVSLDIVDVNNLNEKPWLKYGAKFPPSKMINNIGCESFVEFIKDDSFEYLSKTANKFDFIFLDGSHSAVTVYKEIPVALESLNKNGIILLHDYYPNKKPLWTNRSIIPGPCIATDRFISEGENIEIMPLDELPWMTKIKSNKSSLALLLRKDNY